MSRLEALNPKEATGKTKELFNGIEASLGMIPNMMRTMGQSPAALEAYLNLSGALRNASVGSELGELIALTVSEANECDYCLSAHTFIGEKLAGIDQSTLEAARLAKNDNPKTQAGLEFAKALIEKQGKVSDSDVSQVLEAGYSQGELGEIVAHVALNVFTNYFNNSANTIIDFPRVESVLV